MTFPNPSDTRIQDLLALGADLSASGNVSSLPASGTEEDDALLSATCGDSPGDHIGRYQLLETIGEGGFGQVWLARQLEPVRREVALKRIKPGMDSREIIARFSVERQGLARMEHPSIAAFLDAGATADGRLYFVMERVNGPPLTQYCDDRQLGIAERIELFLQVCEAVQHAHRKAFIHRDLKPSNLLVAEVEGRPVPKVIDFGVAKALGGEDHGLGNETLTRTGAGRIVGTPRYMSPEQAGSQTDIDTRSDVYSLGVVLHELLTGGTPLSTEAISGLSSDAVLRSVREGESGRPSRRLSSTSTRSGEIAAARSLSPQRLESALRGELDWILLRALEKDRERRYPSVGEFAADLRRYLRHEPVKAGPPSHWYRARKFVRRNRLLIGGAATVATLLALGFGLTTWQAVRATRAERVAKSRLEMAEQARDAAEALLSETVIGLRKRLMPVGKSGLIGDSLTAAEAYFERLPEALANQQTVEHTIHFRFSSGLVALIEGRLDAAEEKLAGALADLEALEARTPLNEDLNKEAVSVALMAAHTHVEAEEFEKASHYRAIVRRRAYAWASEHPGALWALASLSHEAGLAGLEAALLTRNPPKAIPHLARLKYYEGRLANLDDTSPEYYQAKGTRLFCEGFASSHLGADPEHVVRLFEAAAATFRLGYESDQSAIYRVVYLDMQLGAETAAGTRLVDLGLAKGDPERFQKGRNLILDAYAERLEQAKWDPRRVEWWKDLAGSCKQIAKLARHTDDSEEADRLAGMVLSTAPFVQAHAGTHPATARTLAAALADLLQWRLSRNAPWDADWMAAAVSIVELRSRRIADTPGEATSIKELAGALDLFDKGLDKASEEVQRNALDELAAIRSGMAEAAAGDPGTAEWRLAQALVATRWAKGSFRWHGDSERADEMFRSQVAQTLALAAELSEGQESPSFATLATLGCLSRDLQAWFWRQDPKEARDRAQALDAAAGGRIAHLAGLAERWNPQRIESHLGLWSVAALRAKLDDAMEPARAEAIGQMIHAFREAVSLADTRDEKEQILASAYDHHFNLLLDRALHLDAMRHDEEALEIHRELVWVRESGIGRLSPFHYECLSLCHLHRAMHFRELGRLEECGASLSEAEKALEALSSKSPGSQRLRLFHHAARVLAASAAPASLSASDLAALIAEQQETTAHIGASHDAVFLDRIWGQLAEAARTGSADDIRASALSEWSRMRKVVSGKRLSPRLQGRLREIRP